MDPRRRTESPELSGGSRWTDLPPELLEGILKLVSPRDRVIVRLVCSSWRTCARASFPSDLPFEAPRLLLRRPGGGLGFFSLRRGEILPFALPARLTAAAARCCGHIGGWLAMAFDDDREIALWNITSGESVPIPRAPLFPVAKIVLSAPPTSPGWVVAVLGRSGTIALLQPGAEGGARWMTIEHGAEHGGFQDMAIWRGRLCALGCDGTVVAYRVSLRRRVAAASVLRAVQHPVGYAAAAAAAAAGQPRMRGRWWMYLAVDIAGELLVVNREYSVRRDAVDMDVEVLRYAAAEQKWEAVEELAGQALFVGSVVSMVAPATEGSGIRENCVYVARREVEMLVPHAIGVYSLAEGDATGLAISGGHSVAAEPPSLGGFPTREEKASSRKLKDNNICGRPTRAAAAATTRQARSSPLLSGQGDEGDVEGAVRGRQGDGGRDPFLDPLRRRPPLQGLRHRCRLRPRPLAGGPHPHPREAWLLPHRPQAPLQGFAVPVHELGAAARPPCQPHLHALHRPLPGPRRAAFPHRARLLPRLRSGQQAQPLPRARLRRLPRQVLLRARPRTPHHHRALLRHRQERLGLRRHPQVPRRGCRQGHLPRLHQAARPRVDQGLQDRWLLQGCNFI